jgi:hypothetical protein
MAAGVTSKLWKMSDMVEVLEDREGANSGALAASFTVDKY